jgi:hypothetical protein
MRQSDNAYVPGGFPTGTAPQMHSLRSALIMWSTLGIRERGCGQREEMGTGNRETKVRDQ